MRAFHSVADLENAVGTHVGYSDWHPVTQRQIDQFAEATGDHQWIHVDRDRAATGPFGSTIAHGYLTLSLVPMLTAEVYSVAGLQMGVNYGAERLRFPAPVPVDAHVRAGVEIISVTPGDAAYRLVARVTVERQGSDKPVCVVDAVSVLVP
ncbi:MaoC family dehydratase [Nocardioides panacisoli]|uniref:MaoC family dehydratase n=1 Tax=Nocardioides panacisoli TaxID=627624 RepID=UPI001C62561A|nr:MaoC family dehydratase [Nocardioides panacisoli]QYJ03534.1 MaoC family dehydratase [Nocardioides panacisoli]